MDEILNKYSEGVLKNIDKGNMNKIIKLLKEYNCDFIDDIIEDYLDLFTIDYDEFKNKFVKLNEIYENKFLEYASFDMNLLEKFFK